MSPPFNINNPETECAVNTPLFDISIKYNIITFLHAFSYGAENISLYNCHQRKAYDKLAIPSSS